MFEKTLANVVTFVEHEGADVGFGVHDRRQLLHSEHVRTPEGFQPAIYRGLCVGERQLLINEQTDLSGGQISGTDLPECWLEMKANVSFRLFVAMASLPFLIGKVQPEQIARLKPLPSSPVGHRPACGVGLEAVQRHSCS